MLHRFGPQRLALKPTRRPQVQAGLALWLQFCAQEIGKQAMVAHPFPPIIQRH